MISPTRSFVRAAVPSIAVSRSIATGPRRVFSIIASAPVGVHQNLHFTRLPVVFFLVAIFLVKVLEVGHMSHSISSYFCLVKTFLIRFGQLNHTSALNPCIHRY